MVFQKSCVFCFILFATQNKLQAKFNDNIQLIKIKLNLKFTYNLEGVTVAGKSLRSTAYDK